MVRTVTMEQAGFVSGCRHLLHHRDSKFSAGFDRTTWSKRLFQPGEVVGESLRRVHALEIR